MDDFISQIIENIHIFFTFYRKNYVLLADIGHCFDYLILKVLPLHQNPIGLIINFDQGYALVGGDNKKSFIIRFCDIIDMIMIWRSLLRNFLSRHNFLRSDVNHGQSPLQLPTKYHFTIDRFDALKSYTALNSQLMEKGRFLRICKVEEKEQAEFGANNQSCLIA